MKYRFDLSERIGILIGAGLCFFVTIGHLTLNDLPFWYGFNVITVSLAAIYMVFTREKR